LHETRIEVNGEELLLEAAGALWWPGESTLVFADMHFEKGSFYARTGQMLPPYDTRATIARIEAVVARRRGSSRWGILSTIVMPPNVWMKRNARG
jgi:uncharacterized protein